MKAILEFSIPEEQEEHQLALDAWKYKAVLDDFWKKLRAKEKHENQDSYMIEELREIFAEVNNAYFDD